MVPWEWGLYACGLGKGVHRGARTFLCVFSWGSVDLPSSSEPERTRVIAGMGVGP